MDYKINYITPDIKLSCYEGKPFKTDALFEDHLLVWLLSGETRLIMADATYGFQANQIFLIPRHQLATVINSTVTGQPHRSVAMHLTTAGLREFYRETEARTAPVSDGRIRRFDGHPLLKSFLASLLPYFEIRDPFPETIAALKIREAVSILRIIDPDIDGLLTSFADPGKIHLAEFMEKNYMFNMPLKKFGYLTGRSVSTFNRDFKKIYQTTPQKWLTQKRLALAYYQLAEEKKRPVDVYLEVGFEDLSHFSSAFKKQYGYAPTALAQKKPQ